METYNIAATLAALDWEALSTQLHRQGFALVQHILPEAACNMLVHDYQADQQYRKTINMQRYRFGQGEYKYFNYPLPPLLQQLREAVYPYLAPVANQWMHALRMSITYPGAHAAFIAQCHAHGQLQPTALILQYGAGGFNTLHQDLYGDLFFPLQIVLMLNQPGRDYTGGEFVLTEQMPRAQSKASVLQPQQGDMLVFTTNFRPMAGSKGYYRAAMKHGVSPVHSGQRYSLGIIFHDGRS